MGTGNKTTGLIFRSGMIYIDLRFCARGKPCSGDVDNEPNRTKWLNNLDEMRDLHANNRLNDLRFNKFFARDMLDTITFEELVAKWKVYLPTHRKKNQTKLRSSTIHYYGEYMDCCWVNAFADERGNSLPINKITLKMIKTFIVEEMGKFTPKALGNYSSALRLIFAFAVEREYIRADQNPTIGLPATSRYGKLDDSKVLPFEKIQPMLDACRTAAAQMYSDWQTGEFIQNELAGELYYNYFDFSVSTGMRPAEQIALRVGDIDPEQQRVRVWRTRVMVVTDGVRCWEDVDGTKNGESRKVQLKPRAWAAIERQMKLRGLAFGKDEQAHLFVMPDGKRFHDLQMTGKVYKIADLEVFGARQKVGRKEEKRRSQYAMRHTSVTLNLMMGKRSGWVAEQHGHSEQVMRQVYAHWLHWEDDDGEKMNPAIARINAFYGITTRSNDLSQRRLANTVEEKDRRIAELEAQLAARDGQRKAA